MDVETIFYVATKTISNIINKHGRGNYLLCRHTNLSQTLLINMDVVTIFYVATKSISNIIDKHGPGNYLLCRHKEQKPTKSQGQPNSEILASLQKTLEGMKLQIEDLQKAVKGNAKRDGYPRPRQYIDKDPCFKCGTIGHH